MLIVISSVILPNGVQKLRKFWTSTSNYPNPSFTSLHNNNTPIFMVRWEANNREFHPVNVELEQLVARLQFPVEATIRITGPQIHGCCELLLNVEAWRIRTDRNTIRLGARKRRVDKCHNQCFTVPPGNHPELCLLVVCCRDKESDEISNVPVPCRTKDGSY